jgi:hypothetical protein
MWHTKCELLAYGSRKYKLSDNVTRQGNVLRGFLGRCSVLGVRCSVCGVRCSMCGVRCAVFGVRYRLGSVVRSIRWEG